MAGIKGKGGAKGRSGRKRFDIEAKDKMDKLYPLAITILDKVLKGIDVPYNEQLSAAKYVADHKLGKPVEHRELDITSLREITVTIEETGSRERPLLPLEAGILPVLPEGRTIEEKAITPDISYAII